MKKDLKKEKTLDLNVNLKVVTEKGYEHMFITLEDGTRFQVRYAFYNNKLAYKVKKTLEERSHVKQ